MIQHCDGALEHLGGVHKRSTVIHSHFAYLSEASLVMRRDIPRRLLRHT